MKRSRFLIPSLLAAGFTPHDPALGGVTQATSGGSDDPNVAPLFDIFRQGHAITLAQHRSHSSHSSHRSSSGGGGHYSHTSHRSSTGGYDSPSYTPPLYSPAPSPPPPPAPPLPSLNPRTDRASPPRETELPALSGRSQRFAAIVRRVQIALLAQGFYHGGIDGVVGPILRGAIRKFQTSRRLTVTGTITPQVLDALRIASE